MLEKSLLIFKAHIKAAMAVFVLSLVLLVAAGMLTPKVYESQTSIFIQKKVPTMDDTANTPFFSDTELTDHVKIMKSNYVMDSVAERLKKDFPTHPAISKGAMATRMRTVTARNTRLITLSFQDSDPKYAAAMLAYTLEEYDKALKNMTRDSKSKSLNLMRDRIASIQADRREIERRVEALRAESGTLDLDAKNAELVKTSAVYSQTLGNLNAQISASQNEIDHLSKMIGLSSNEVRLMARIKDDPQIRSLQSDLGKQQAELTEMKASFTDKYSGVIEKERSIKAIQDALEGRIKKIYGAPFNNDNLVYSNIDNSMGQKLIDQNVQLLAMLGQKQHYEKLLDQMPAEISQLAAHEKEMSELQYRMSSLKEEERKISSKLREDMMTQELADNVGSFLVITPPRVPKDSEYVFPLKPKNILTYGISASALLALFSIGLLEYFSPRVINLDPLPVLAKVEGYEGATEGELKNAYQNIAMLINKMDLRTVTMLHLCGDKGARKIKKGKGGNGDFQISYSSCPYSPSIFANQLAIMFSRRDVKTLLLDCTNTCVDENQSIYWEPIDEIVEHTLYQFKGLENLHILKTNQNNQFFDPYTLKLLPDYDDYELILLNVTLSQNEMLNQLLCDMGEATVVGISKSQTSSETVRHFLNNAKIQDLKVLGSIIFS